MAGLGRRPYAKARENAGNFNTERVGNKDRPRGLPEWGPAECGAKTACFLRFSDADDGEGGGFKRRDLYQSGKGVSFF